MAEEPFLQPSEARLNLFPIRYPAVWQRYKKALEAFWVPGEVDLSGDLEDWDNLTPDERHFLLTVLAFFAAADGLVNDNLAERFGREVQVREARCFYALQQTIENIHNEMYSLLIDTYVREDVAARDRLFHAVETVDCVRAKAEWAKRWIDDRDASFATRLVAFAVVEGVFFSASFCAIFFFKQRALLPGLCQANSLISRDEGMHQDFAVLLYTNHVRDPLTDEEVHAIVGEAVAIEEGFCRDALKVSLVGMNADDMVRYVRFVADRLLVQLGHPKLFHATNPFDWMELLSLEGKSNFFEKKVSEYKKCGVDTVAQHVFATDAAF